MHLKAETRWVHRKRLVSPNKNFGNCTRTEGKGPGGRDVFHQIFQGIKIQTQVTHVHLKREHRLVSPLKTRHREVFPHTYSF